MSSTALALHDSLGYDADQFRMLTDVICKGFSPPEVEFFVNVCKAVELDPLKRQIYAMPRSEGYGDEKRTTMVIMTSIEGLRSIASRCVTKPDGKDAYAGNDKPVFQYNQDGSLFSAECTVYRMVQGERRPFSAEVFYDECVQMKQIWGQDPQNPRNQRKVRLGEEPNSMWKKRPRGQLGKCAEAAALRKGFPEQTAGIYVDAEGPVVEERREAPEKPVHTTESVRQGASTEHVQEAEVVNEEGEIPTWQQLSKGDKWREVKMGEGMPYEGETVEFIAKSATKLKDAWSKVPADTVQRAALYAEQWSKIERYIAAQNTNVSDVEILLKQTQVLPDEGGIMDCPGHKLPKLYDSIKKAIREKDSPPAPQGE